MMITLIFILVLVYVRIIVLSIYFKARFFFLFVIMFAVARQGLLSCMSLKYRSWTQVFSVILSFFLLRFTAMIYMMNVFSSVVKSVCQGCSDSIDRHPDDMPI